jgi:hypothetical protein
VPHTVAEVAAYVADAWPLIAEDPSTGRWASEFAANQQTVNRPPDPPSEIGKLGSGQRIDHDLLHQQYRRARFSRSRLVMGSPVASKERG